MSEPFENFIDSLNKNIDLHTRLKVMNEMNLIMFLTECGFREDKMWTPEEDELLTKLFDFAKTMTDDQIQIINEWTEDGCPDKDDFQIND
jgi:hypothetical protein